jgi:DNA-binding CsgD family transcriptional regulator
MSTTMDEESVASRLCNAQLALRAAWYDAALDLLDGCQDWDQPHAEQAVALKAETLGRRDGVAAVEWIVASHDLVATPGGRFAYELAAGKAFANVRNIDSALSHYADAAALTGAVTHGEATLSYHRARLAWMRREYDPHSADNTRAVAHPDPNVALSAYATRGWHHGSLGDYGAQIEDFMRALHLLDTSDGVLDVSASGVTCHSLARVAFETANASAIEAARGWYERIAWSPDVNVDRFQTLRALGWDWFMRGRAARAQWAFKDARDAAPSAAWQVTAHLDRAYVARIAHNAAWAAEELEAADRLAYSVDWSSTSGEERLALVTLAILQAPENAARAQRYASTYSRIGSDSVHPTLALSSDPRAHAFARFAQGRIDQMLGRREPAIAALREAYDMFAKIGYAYQAAMAASALCEITGERAWRDLVTQHASAYPECPLGSMADGEIRSEQTMPVALTPLQRQIARALWNGLDTSEISRRMSRSIYTIERQIAAVLEAFRVGSKAELLTMAHQQGLR